MSWSLPQPVIVDVWGNHLWEPTFSVLTLMKVKKKPWSFYTTTKAGNWDRKNMKYENIVLFEHKIITHFKY